MNFKKMTKTKWISLLLFFMLLVQSFGGFSTVLAEESNASINASIRVEGLNETIAEGEGKGSNSLEIFKNVLDIANVKYTVKPSTYGNLIDEIAGLKSGKLGDYSGWSYYVKNSKEIIIPQVGVEAYIPKDKDEIIFYYSNFPLPSLVNNIKFLPEVVKSNEKFTMKFSYSNFDYIKNIMVDTPIEGAVVTIDNIQPMITDKNGEIVVQSLSKGEHSYKVSGYNKDKISTVVMDKGTFTIDDVNSPSFNYADNSFDKISKDTKNIPKDINKELASTSNHMKNISDNWVAMSMHKAGIKPNETFIKNYAEDIKKYGIAEISNTELEKLIMGLAACGYTPYDFMGIDLPSELFNRNSSSFLMYESIFGLEAYNFANIKEQYPVSKKILIDNILKDTINYTFNSSEMLGWSYSKDEKIIDPDTTAMVITALAPYYESDANVKDKVNKAIKSLSIIQSENGLIGNSWGAYNETQAMTILALTSIGVSPEGEMFTKSRGDLVTALLSFKGENGQFKHEHTGNDDVMATEQSLRALIALKGYKDNGTRYNYYSSDINSKQLKKYTTDSNELKLPNDKNINDNKSVNNSNLNNSKVQDVKSKANSNNNNKINNLPKTGTFVDYTFLICAGLILICCGLFILRNNFKKVKEDN